MARVQRAAGELILDHGQPDGFADIGISDPAFNAASSVRGFSVERLRQHLRPSTRGAECRRPLRIQFGRNGQHRASTGALAYIGNSILCR